MSSYANGRKPHVWVSQDTILDALREIGPSRLDDIAEFFDVSQASVRRKLDGAVAQRKALLCPGTGTGGPTGAKAEYAALDADGRVEWGECPPEDAARRQEVIDLLEGRSS